MIFFRKKFRKRTWELKIGQLCLLRRPQAAAGRLQLKGDICGARRPLVCREFSITLVDRIDNENYGIQTTFFFFQLLLNRQQRFNVETL